MKKALPLAAAGAALGLGALGACLLLGACASGPVGNSAVPQPAKDVDLQRYLGKWHELARYDNRFERGCDAVTAEYRLLPDGKIEVINTCGVDANGKPRSATGKAKVVANTGNAKLKVSFFGPFYVGDYWVLDHADDYSWSIVGEPSGKYLWILTRDASPGDAVRADMIRRIQALGYDDTLLRFTRHGPAATAQLH